MITFCYLNHFTLPLSDAAFRSLMYRLLLSVPWLWVRLCVSVFVGRVAGNSCILVCCVAIILVQCCLCLKRGNRHTLVLDCILSPCHLLISVPYDRVKNYSLFSLPFYFSCVQIMKTPVELSAKCIYYLLADAAPRLLNFILCILSFSHLIVVI